MKDNQKKYWSKAKKKTLADRTVYDNQPIKNQINNQTKLTKAGTSMYLLFYY